MMSAFWPSKAAANHMDNYAATELREPGCYQSSKAKHTVTGIPNLFRFRLGQKEKQIHAFFGECMV